MTSPPDRGLRWSGLIGGALAVAAITVLARLLGLGRWVVFSKTVGAGCLADAYNTANLLPTVMFEVVAGGALAGVMVPVLAGAAARGDRAWVDRTVSALLAWTLLLLIPVTVALALAARPAIRLFLDADGDCAAAVDAGTRMLLLFLPQVLCYGIAVVCSGALQAHRRLLAAAAAPLVSSCVVIGAYLCFVVLADGERSVAAVPREAETALAVGTTLGVLALAGAVAVPLRRAGIRLRPTLRFPTDVRAKVQALAAAGVAVLVAQHLTLLAVAWIANHGGYPGALTVFTWAWAIYLVPYAVLAIPITTSAFPRLAQAVEAAEPGALAQLCARTTRAVLVVGAAGAVLLAGSAVPVSRVFASHGGLADADRLADGTLALAPGVIGFGLLAHLTRVLYAGHHGRAAAGGAGLAWASVVLVDVLAAAALSEQSVVVALGIGNAVGMSLGAAVLLTATRRLHGASALTGLRRTAGAALAAAGLAAAPAYLLGHLFSDAGFGPALLGSLLCAAVGLSGFGAVLAAIDRSTAREVRAALRGARGPRTDDPGLDRTGSGHRG